MISYIVIVILRTISANKLMKLIYPNRFIFQAIVVTAVVTIGYFLRVVSLNILILIFLFIWSCYSNKELVKTTFETLLKRIKH